MASCAVASASDPDVCAPSEGSNGLFLFFSGESEFLNQPPSLSAPVTRLLDALRAPDASLLATGASLLVTEGDSTRLRSQIGQLKEYNSFWPQLRVSAATQQQVDRGSKPLIGSIRQAPGVQIRWHLVCGLCLLSSTLLLR